LACKNFKKLVSSFWIQKINALNIDKSLSIINNETQILHIKGYTKIAKNDLIAKECLKNNNSIKTLRFTSWSYNIIYFLTSNVKSLYIDSKYGYPKYELNSFLCDLPYTIKELTLDNNVTYNSPNHITSFTISRLNPELIINDCSGFWKINTIESYNALSLAVMKRNIDLIFQLLEKGCDINYISKSGSTILMYAFKPREPDGKKTLLEIANIIFKNGFKLINHIDNHGFTQLHYSLHNIEILKLLLENGADPNVYDKKRGPILLCQVCNIENDEAIIPFIELLFKYGVKPNVSTRPNDFALYYLINNIYIPTEIKIRAIQIFIQNGANLNYSHSDEDEDSLLINSINDTTILSFIIKNGARPKRQDILKFCLQKNRFYAFMVFLKHGFPFIKEDSLKKYIDKMIGNFIYSKEYKKIDILIKNEIIERSGYFCVHDDHPDHNNNYSFTPLYMAVLRNDIKLVLTFLEYGCNPNEQVTVDLEHLSIFKDENLLSLFLKKDVLIQDMLKPSFKFIVTPFLLALLFNNTDIIELLLHYGAQIDFESNIFHYLNIAIFHENSKIMLLFYEKGAKINHMSSVCAYQSHTD
jgi:ankyrin repeat protein